MRVALIVAVIAASLGGCARPVRPVPPSVPVAVMPFSDDPVSFLVSSRRFSPGEVTIVRVCVGPDRSISSTDIMESSGDPRFDTLALDWARRIQLRAAPPAGGAPVLPCGEVRVEIKAPAEPRGLSRPDTSLG
jgi:TonB family protein